MVTSSPESSRCSIVTSGARSRVASSRCAHSMARRRAKPVATTLAKRNQYPLGHQKKGRQASDRSACLADQPVRCAQQWTGQQDGSSNGREPGDQENERDGNGDRLDTIVTSLILIEFGAAQ